VIVVFTVQEVADTLDLYLRVVVLFQPITEWAFFDVSVAGAIRPIVKVTIT